MTTHCANNCSVSGAPRRFAQEKRSSATASIPLPARAYRRSMSSRVRSICSAGTPGKSASPETIHLNAQNSECWSSASNISGRWSHQRSSWAKGT
ncbi:hypothetical protein [Cellulomonas denverensis]|uniref:hypothetical protein n=1 Tax=Cellulomonas denverensis TaxID=264297 RepID=UPI0035EB2BD0